MEINPWAYLQQTQGVTGGRSSKKNSEFADEDTGSGRGSEQVSLSPDAVSLLSAPGPTSDGIPSQPKKKWTILVYADGNSNLEPEMVKKLLDLERVGSDDKANIVMQLSRTSQERGGSPAVNLGSWSGTRRYYVTKDKDGNPRTVDSQVVAEWGKTEMADPKSLENFLEWGMKEYPAEHTMVIMAGHGAGPIGIMGDGQGKKAMSISDLKAAMLEAEQKAGTGKVDVLTFESCFMGSTEVANEMKDVAKTMVASEGRMGKEGLPLGDLLTHMKSMRRDRFENPRTIARMFVNDTKHNDSVPFLTAVDLERWESAGVKGAINALAEDLLKYGPSVKGRIANQQRFDHADIEPGGDFIDARYMAARMAMYNKRDLPELYLHADRVRTALDSVILAEHSPWNDRADDGPSSGGLRFAGGLSLYLPRNPRDYGKSERSENYARFNDLYSKLDFAQENDWYPFLKQLQDPSSWAFADADAPDRPFGIWRPGADDRPFGIWRPGEERRDH